MQIDALVQAGVLKDDIYQEQASGKDMKRPGLESYLKALRDGDILVVWKLDRLGRSSQHLVNTVQKLAALQKIL